MSTRKLNILITLYKNINTGKKEQVVAMFDNIAGKYDFLNHLLSIGIDKNWRKRAIKILKEFNPESILDVATGTGDFAIESIKLNPKEVIGIDISHEMLKIGEKKIKKIGLENLVSFYPGDSEKLNFQDHRFDAVIVAFGVRNFENLSSGINEIFRVIKPGGVFVVLEFSIPGNFPVKQLFNFYFFKILPVIGRIISKDKSAYSYLPASVNAFPDRDDFLSVLNSAGFVNTKYKLQSFGIAAIYWGTKN